MLAVLTLYCRAVAGINWNAPCAPTEERAFGFWQKQCRTCTERQSRYYYKRKAEKYLTPSEVNVFPPMPEILKPAYWRKYP